MIGVFDAGVSAEAGPGIVVGEASALGAGAIPGRAVGIACDVIVDRGSVVSVGSGVGSDRGEAGPQATAMAARVMITKVRIRHRRMFGSFDILLSSCSSFLGAHYGAGFITRPRNRSVPVALSRMRKMKGRSTVTGMGSLVGPEVGTTTAVAAAASVPRSSTDTNAL